MVQISWPELMRGLRIPTRYSRLVDPTLALSHQAPMLLLRAGCILVSLSDELLSAKAVITPTVTYLIAPAYAPPPSPSRPSMARSFTTDGRNSPRSDVAAAAHTTAVFESLVAAK